MGGKNTNATGLLAEKSMKAVKMIGFHEVHWREYLLWKDWPDDDQLNVLTRHYPYLDQGIYGTKCWIDGLLDARSKNRRLHTVNGRARVLICDVGKARPLGECVQRPRVLSTGSNGHDGNPYWN